MAKLVIEHVPISDLKEWGENPRYHNVEAIRRSMERFGIRWPIIVNRNTMQVEAGHGRLKALRELGETEVPVLFVDDDDLTAKAFAIADNRTQELTQWDEQGLADVLTELEAGGELGPTAFSIDDLNELLRKLGRFEGEDFDVEAAMAAAPDQVANTKRGEVWQLGRHRLMCGDSTKAEDVERLGIRLDMPLFTDPPYGIGYDPSWLDGVGTHRRMLSSRDTIINDDGSLDLSGLWQFGRRMVWGFPYVYDSAATGWIVWDKQPGVESRGIVTPIEMASTTMRKGFDMVRVMWGGYYRASDEDKQPHPTQKPLAVYRRFIEAWTKPNEIVADLFAGCAPVLIVCEQTGRNCYGMEIIPHYCDVAIARWEAFTGGQAVLVEERELAYA